jgi:hypothetical protein
MAGIWVQDQLCVFQIEHEIGALTDL